MTTLKAIIVDDEALARRGLELRLAAYDDIEVVANCSNGREAVRDIPALKPDLVFLDIQMPGMDGFEVLKALAGPDLPRVVFVTAFDHFAIQAFDACAVDYLLKPINDQRLAEAIGKVREAISSDAVTKQRDHLLDLLTRINGEEISLDDALESASEQNYSRRIAIRDGRKTACVEVSDIEWIDAARDYMCIHANGKTHVLRGTMKKLEQTLDPLQFVRIHRSTIVNRLRVVALKPHRNGEYFVQLDSDREFKLSRKYKANIERIASRL
ncbi:MAG: response regulator transcription factor [Pseudomonadota bacterium]